MAKDLLIRLSVYPYVRRYLLFHYSEPFFVTEPGYVTALLRTSLEPMPKVHPSQIKPKDKLNFGAFIGFMVGEGTLRKNGCCVSSENVKLFNAAVLDLLHEEMYRFIIAKKALGMQVDDSIRDFQALYNFDEDELPFENLKRWYYRERIRLEGRSAERRVVDPQFTLNFFAEKTDEPAPVINLNQNLLFAV